MKTETPAAAAEKTVASLEKHPIEAPDWRERFDAARAAVAKLRAIAVAIIFRPEVGAELDFTALAWFVDLWPRNPYFGQLAAALHERSLLARPGLAAALRLPEIRDLAGDAAASAAHVERSRRTAAEQTAAVAAAAAAKYESAVARAIVDASHDLEAPARDVLAADELAGRLDALAERRRVHDLGEAARLEAARAAAAAAALEVEKAAHIEEALSRTTLHDAYYRDPVAARAAALLSWRLSRWPSDTIRQNRGFFSVPDLARTAMQLSPSEVKGWSATLDAREAEGKAS